MGCPPRDGCGFREDLVAIHDIAELGIRAGDRLMLFGAQARLVRR
jgi:hypothetical protein